MRQAFLISTFAAALAASLALGAAQEPGGMPETAAPPATKLAPAETAKPATTPSARPADASMTARDRQLLTDFGGLARYKEQDMKLVSPTAGESRVVFMGDSITDAWRFDGPDGSFPGKPYINRGFSGQTTPQMVLRFRQDVIDLQPKVVVILAGTNDIAGNTGPMTLEQSEDNIRDMADLAAANHIRVVLCSVLPAYDFPWRPGLEPAPKIVRLNQWISRYASEKGYVYVDYHSAMKDARDGLPPELSHDGVHPTAAGYKVMAPLVENGIAKALAK